MIKILHTIPALDGGGADRVLYDYSIRMLENIHFDFIIHTDNEGILEPNLRQKDCEIFHIPPAHSGVIKYFFNIMKIIKEGEYDIIHVSQGYLGVVFLCFAKLNGIKVRIAHSHMAYIPESRLQRVKRHVLTLIATLLATDLFACGKDAAEWMWGTSHNKGHIHIMPNGIDVSKFVFSEKKRAKLREQFGIENKYVIGNVARFSYQKNHMFLIEIFNKISKKNDDAVLVLIGGGELENSIKLLVEELGLTDKVIFLGVRNDVCELLNMMDVFVLPSRFEGLPVTLIEVQVNGLPVVVSTAITNEAKISENFIALSLNEDINVWESEIQKRKRNQTFTDDSLVRKYDISILAKQQMQWYIDRCSKEK